MIRILLTLIFVFQSISCEKQYENNAFPSLAFRENQELISSVKRFNNLSMSIPKNMEKLDSVSFKQLELSFENIKDSYFVNDILAAFTNKDGFTCIISSVKHKNIVYDVLKNKVEPRFSEVYGEENLITGQFSIKDNKVFQMILRDEKITNYKFYIDVLSNNSYQIDYFIPAKNFTKLQEAMEASIFTINVKSKENKDEK